ncbi:MAG TPA: c-type cytochrome [Salinisphaeraceae bacterium]|nr:c-type cytochrome [Salinisphaeraceae bacterium]
MSCSTGDFSCDVPRRRGALIVLGLMAVIFLLLSAFSFVGSRDQVTPAEFTYNGYTADEGKRVFQAYNCMGCHTIVGNGAYLGPDLTDQYAHAGPAWLEAFLPSAGSWPTEGALRTQVVNSEILAEKGIESLEDYLAQYPGAAERVQRRGGRATQMPNLPLTQEETGKLIAFFKYTAAMNTEGWPPEVRSGDLDQRLQHMGVAAAAAMPVAAAAGSAAENAAKDADADPVARGEQLAQDQGCTACHASDATRRVGPGWGGLYNSEIKLADGSTVTVDEAYLTESIRDPNASVPEGYTPGIMPAYTEAMLTDDEVEAIVAYLASLKDGEE